MLELTESQKARVAIRSFTTIVDALALRGFCRLSDTFGQALMECLLDLSPEIYGSINDPHVVELKGLEYTFDRLPRGIEQVRRIILTEEEDFKGSSFERITPLRRRSTCYRLSENEMCLIITRGLSEIYDLMAHLTFLFVEANKIHKRMRNEHGETTTEWRELEKAVNNLDDLTQTQLDQAIWNLSLIIGRSYAETRQSYAYFEQNRQSSNSNNGLFSMVYHLGLGMEIEKTLPEQASILRLTPSLMSRIGHQQYGLKWAANIKAKLAELDLAHRPLHIISANMHSFINMLYGYGPKLNSRQEDADADIYRHIQAIKDYKQEVMDYGREHGLYELPDLSGTNIDCQLIDTAKLKDIDFHPSLDFKNIGQNQQPPVLMIMDYAFGTQAFEVMDRFLSQHPESNDDPMDVRSISIMGKAGILVGNVGDVMLATAHVIEGSSDNYIFDNDLRREHFDDDVNVYEGPMITVVGTSLQNKNVLKRLQTGWHTVGLEMEGGHYQRAISAAILKGHIFRNVVVRYAYYASDNPLQSGKSLAAGPMGDVGIKPTYMITKAILERIFNPEDDPKQ